jgi:hypothetical protein
MAKILRAKIAPIGPKTSTYNDIEDPPLIVDPGTAPNTLFVSGTDKPVAPSVDTILDE